MCDITLHHVMHDITSLHTFFERIEDFHVVVI